VTGSDRSIPPVGTLLGVWAHPDDEAYLSSALMAGVRRAGGRVVVVTATRGENGTNDPARWPPHRLAEQREREMRASLDVVGVTEHHWLAHRDGELSGVPTPHGARELVPFLDRLDPDTVITFGPDGMTGHQDHQTVSAWATAAHAAAAPDARLLYATTTEEFVQAWQPARDQFPIFLADGLPLRTRAGDLAVSLRLPPAVIDRKIVALRAQASQTAALFTALGEARVRQWFSTETFVAADPADPVRAHAPQWGTWRVAA
jgi:LmbE family N-acetylglucosaminyl deacetylase